MHGATHMALLGDERYANGSSTAGQQRPDSAKTAPATNLTGSPG